MKSRDYFDLNDKLAAIAGQIIREEEKIRAEEGDGFTIRALSRASRHISNAIINLSDASIAAKRLELEAGISDKIKADKRAQTVDRDEKGKRADRS